MVKTENAYWFALIFIALIFAFAGTTSPGPMSMVFFLISIGLLVVGIGNIGKTLEECAVDEESGAAEEKEAEKEEGFRKEDMKFRLNDETRVKTEISRLQRLYRSGKISKRKYKNEVDDLKNELEELKTGVEFYTPAKKKKQ